MKLVGNLIALVLWGFCLGLGLWAWNQVADRYANPKVNAFFEKRAEKKSLAAATEVK
jgi:hypothetical protein